MAVVKENQTDNKAFTEECNAVLMAVSDALYAIGGKWKLMIIIAMARGNKRFTEIQRQVNGISARVLSSELKELELNGFIIKKVAVGYPVSIEYELLPYSQTLEEVVGAMTKWGMQHRQKIRDESSLESSSKK
ncbi:winged helix-turn-helix transcriptional regulator [Flavobacterium undicola]|uniref:winged helix-turn-helix transcriptional regulator n=1 Tax=Flavobacterium undicola TaxID=1932779 RepID=UPI001377425B|nr:helix-turn-helix domain-containing protein [Flavobacterium undicola]MBA0883140.1 helix-turn-helix transcriptional regulator [Flavobacterium undicola]